jgi:carboxyl-terminal processing protease
MSTTDRVVVLLPTEDSAVAAALPLVHHERTEFEAALGVPVALASTVHAVGPTDIAWRFTVDRSLAAPVLEWLPERREVTSRGANGAMLLASLNLLHPLVRTGGQQVRGTTCADPAAAVARIVSEVAGSYPSFALRGLDWRAICGRHGLTATDPAAALPAVQRWLAELGDAHTWAHEVPRQSNPPYVVRASPTAAVMHRVPTDSAAYDAGVRPGWRLEAADPADWWRRTGASPHAKEFVVGRRMMAMSVNSSRPFTAWSPDGRQRLGWEEPIPLGTPAPRWHRVDSETGYLAVPGWTAATADALDVAMTDLQHCARLVVDLRGNPGGNLMAAIDARDRFVRSTTAIGAIRYSDGVGGLGPANPLNAEPSDRMRWRGNVVVLTDPVTYSASEDFLLGLAGLDHVKVIGQPTGGGSGRPRTISLLPGIDLTISTALTYDRQGRCIENAGILPDIAVDLVTGVAADAALVERGVRL